MTAQRVMVEATLSSDDKTKIYINIDHIAAVFKKHQYPGFPEAPTTVVLNNGLHYEVKESPYSFHQWFLVR